MNIINNAVQTGYLKGILSQSETNTVKSVKENKKENTVYKMTDGNATLKIQYDSSKNKKALITLTINANYTYKLEQDGNIIKLKDFYHEKVVAVYDNVETVSYENDLSKEESDKFKSYLNSMIKATPHHKTILNYVKEKTSPGKVVLDK
ncbi:MAG: hypothetical protein ABIH00_07345 [Armatimonadota bacterium]